MRGAEAPGAHLPRDGKGRKGGRKRAVLDPPARRANIPLAEGRKPNPLWASPSLSAGDQGEREEL